MQNGYVSPVGIPTMPELNLTEPNFDVLNIISPIIFDYFFSDMMNASYRRSVRLHRFDRFLSFFYSPCIYISLKSYKCLHYLLHL